VLHEFFQASKICLDQKKIAFTIATIERDLVNGARVIDTLKQITYNIKKTNVESSWREIGGTKRNWNSSKMLTPRKQPKRNRYQPSKLYY